MTRSERQEDGTRSGVGTLTRLGTRPRPQQAPEAGQVAPDPRRGRPARPVPPQRPVAARQAVAAPPRPGLRRRAGAPPQAPPAGRGGGPQRVRTTGPQQAVPATPPAQALQAQPQAHAGPAAASSHRMPFVLLLCGLLGGALVSALVISTTLAEGSFQISKLQDSTSSLAKQRQILEDEVAQAQAPQQIAQRASQLGMRRVGELRYIDLKTGKTTNDGPTWSGAVNAPGYAP